MIRPVLVSFARTPIAKFRGSLSSLKAPELGALATRAALERTGSSDIEIKEAFLGNVVSAGIGQAPCRQAGKFKCNSNGKFVLNYSNLILILQLTYSSSTKFSSWSRFAK